MTARLPDPASLLGRETPWVEVQVDPVSLERFLAATEGMDSAFLPGGSSGRWAQPIVPPTYLAALRPDVTELQLDFGKVRLNGGTEFTWFAPLYSGQTVRRRTRVVETYEREGTSGRLLFIVLETTYERPDGQLVARARTTTIRR